MLVRFHSEVGGFVMFGDVAVRLLRMMGHSGTVPSAILAADMPAAIERLEAALQGQPDAGEPERGEPEDGPPVGLGQRAQPLLELLRRAVADDVSVTWENATA